MSARAELFESMTPVHRTQFAPGEAESVNALIDAYRAEVLREAATTAEWGGEDGLDAFEAAAVLRGMAEGAQP